MRIIISNNRLSCLTLDLLGLHLMWFVVWLFPGILLLLQLWEKCLDLALLLWGLFGAFSWCIRNNRLGHIWFIGVIFYAVCFVWLWLDILQLHQHIHQIWDERFDLALLLRCLNEDYLGNFLDVLGSINWAIWLSIYWGYCMALVRYSTASLVSFLALDLATKISFDDGYLYF